MKKRVSGMKSQKAKQNLRKPEGTDGYQVGHYLAIENAELNLWAIDMLGIQEEDAILEIGFGPGVSIEEMAKRAPKGYISGIDYSELMVHVAKTRNRDAIEQGQVELRLANVNQLPDFNKQFDKIIAINNIMYWDNPPSALHQLRRVLKPGGTIALVIQRSEEMVKNGECNDEVEIYANSLALAGYNNIRIAIHSIEKQEGKKYSKALRKLGLAYSKRSESRTIAGIYIYANAPTVYESVGDYYQALLMHHAQQRPYYSRSNHMVLQRSNCSYLFQ